MLKLSYALNYLNQQPIDKNQLNWLRSQSNCSH